MACIDDVFPLLTVHWQTARQIHDRLDTWSRISVRECLHKLAAQGLVETMMTSEYPHPTTMFRRRGEG